jgi:hypothetical protein
VAFGKSACESSLKLTAGYQLQNVSKNTVLERKGEVKDSYFRQPVLVEVKGLYTDALFLPAYNPVI